MPGGMLKLRFDWYITFIPCQLKQLSKQDGIFISKTRSLLHCLQSLFCVFQEKYSLRRRRDNTRAAPSRDAPAREISPKTHWDYSLVALQSYFLCFFRYFPKLTTLDLFTDFNHLAPFSLLLYDIIFILTLDSLKLKPNEKTKCNAPGSNFIWSSFFSIPVFFNDTFAYYTKIRNKQTIWRHLRLCRRSVVTRKTL